MKKESRVVKILPIVLIIFSFLYGFYLYPKMPLFMASHWNAGGVVNGYSSRFWGLFTVPLITSILYVLFLLVPKIDPLKENIKKFRGHFDMFILIIIFFLIYIHLLTIFWNLGIMFNMSLALTPAMAVLFYATGVLLEKAQRNWFIGIRTPWTLSSDTIWNKTHKLGGKLFKISAGVCLLGILLPNLSIFFILATAIFSSIYLVIFSYLEYKRHPKKS